MSFILLFPLFLFHRLPPGRRHPPELGQRMDGWKETRGGGDFKIELCLGPLDSNLPSFLK